MKTDELTQRSLVILLAKKLRANLNIIQPITSYADAVHLILEYLDDIEE